MQSETTNRKAQIISTTAFILAVLAAIFLRLYLLELKPLHHDEGVNSHFLLNLAHDHKYIYDPINYHGPTLYYFTLISLAIFGETDFALRVYPAICGVLTVLLIWGLRKGLGLVGTPAAAWCLALSPGLVYFSRDFIHESSFGLFTVGMIVALYHWKSTYGIIFFSIFTGLLFTTKETSVHSTIVLLLSVIAALLWEWLRKLMNGDRPAILIPQPGLHRDLLLRSLSGFLSIFVVIYLSFYTSFFTNLRGPYDFLRSVFMWTGRGVTEHIHDHAFTYYLGVLIKLELPFVIALVIGIGITLWRGSRFGLFTMAWACGMVLGYSLIPYKTPWLMVSMLIALAVFSGYVAQLIFEILKYTAPQLAFIAVLISFALPIAKTSWSVNFVNYDDNNNSTGYVKSFGERLKLRAYSDTQYGYVYAQTDRNLLKLVNEITQVKPASIHISSPDYWPLPWYLRNWTITGYTQEVPDKFSGPLLIATASQREDAEQKLQGHYRSQEFVLRPGVNLILYTKE